MKTIIIYDTKRGSTRQIAEIIATDLIRENIETHIYRVNDPVDISLYDGIIIMSPIYYEKPLDSVLQWIQKHRNILIHRQTCLIAVCMANYFGHPGTTYVYKRYIGMMVKRLGKEPTCKEDITGYILKIVKRTIEDCHRVSQHILSAFRDASNNE